MTKRIFLLLLIAILLTGTVFAMEHRHDKGGMLLGFNLGFGMSFNMFDKDLYSDSAVTPIGNYALHYDAGITFDYYLFSWLSFTTGAFFRPEVYISWDSLMSASDPTAKFFDIVAAPICLTIPISVHINVPLLEFLYFGAGINFNIPMATWLNTNNPDIKGSFFFGFPLDVGFDFIKPGKSGSRFFIRFTPEIHKGGTAVPIGFIYQIYNLKIK